MRSDAAGVGASDAVWLMFGVDDSATALDTVAHIIQVALTPVFLLSGIATLLNVFSTRLARVADQVDAVSKVLEGADRGDAKRSRRGWRDCIAVRWRSMSPLSSAPLAGDLRRCPRHV